MDLMKISKRYVSLPQAVALIYKEEGIAGFFKGLYASCVLIPLNYVIYFDLYERFKKIVQDYTQEQTTFVCFAIPSVLSGILTNLVLCPLWNLRTRIQADIYRGVTNDGFLLLPAVHRIYKKEGFRVLYNGFSAGALGLFHPLIQFVAYEKLKLLFSNKGKQALGVKDIFLSATLSKCNQSDLHSHSIGYSLHLPT
eukprot:TRINITY_DN1251_c0_g1_i1.p1 TRINITY_DN1251_c0_g1~~TRINITY_DN1251_c0_g1_i1.p1  ORF type:complete len:196 (+),score=9.92 TRINITY_DN1251_c0_g1_i1:325-912(+)